MVAILSPIDGIVSHARTSRMPDDAHHHPYASPVKRTGDAKSWSSMQFLFIYSEDVEEQQCYETSLDVC
jgi:hypothetical protein